MQNKNTSEIRRLRIKSKLKQREVAEMLDMSVSTWQRKELSEDSPNFVRTSKSEVILLQLLADEHADYVLAKRKKENEMQASLLKIKNRTFVLPATHDYEFPSYIISHKEKLHELVDLSNALSKMVMNPCDSNDVTDALNSALCELQEFKENTGIIGYPFDARDGKLYALDSGVDVVFEFDIESI